MPLLGIDVGTGGSRALVIDEAGAVLASATEEHVDFASPQTGWAEQSPDDWWRASRLAVRTALEAASCEAGDVRGIGLSGQMHGSVLLDAADSVVRPALLWCDQRTQAECDWLTETVGRQRLIELTSNPALTGFTLPKLLWVRTHEPELWERVRSILLPKDYVRFKLTGERATDMADASGTLLLDVAHRRWSSEMLAATGLDTALLPSLHEGPEITGRLSTGAAAEAGLAAGTPVVAGGGDQSAGAVGMGIVRPGAVSATIGTSGVVFAATDAPALDSEGRVHTFCHAVPGRWHVMGVTQAAGLSLRWFRDRFGAGDDDGRDPYDRLADEAAEAPVGSNGVLWAPYLMGERTPHLDANARAALVGLAASHTRAHVVRAILEGVAFSLRDSFTILATMQVPVNEIRLGGGGARSPLWRQVQADVYRHQVATLAAEEGAAYGAALLAGVGTGVWRTVDEACDAAVAIADRVDPNEADAAVLDRHYARYRALYPAITQVLNS
ncbi:MAG: xylulokinase [Vicinamibacterales bacterium]|jgi:xylulokinase|nr:xylulokinase [Acidobacteriota bacterium]MDP6370895.1 xylulokinase [Vicinamibacterales bacterium]MDP6608125.1 xylulokinase [Vicinamibacterales bacterium]HAK53977.1 xylulokinase [Acidobacteriota bacterium]|tara:strand:+ start:4609 stop:6105 length:1497 start_codon:yes stop_codon:yes gene_type:complete